MIKVLLILLAFSSLALGENINPETLSGEEFSSISYLNSTETGSALPPQKISILEGILSSFTFIFSSEIGDKTFILVILYAFNMNSMMVWVASSIALVGMHLISVLVGNVISGLISELTIAMIGAAMFILCGLYYLYLAVTDKGDETFED